MHAVLKKDGDIASSRELTRAQIFDLVQQREASGWRFVYPGANQDAYAEGGSIGVAHHAVTNWQADADGTNHVFSRLSDAMSQRRAMRRGGDPLDAVDAVPFFDDDEATDR